MQDQAHRLRELALAEKRRTNAKQRKTRRISVTSGKGGVGKSSFSLNFALLTTKLGRKTLLIDADTNLANLDILMGISPRFNLSHVLAGMKTARDILLEGAQGLSILPAASGNIEQVMHEGIGSEAIIADLDSLEEEFDIIVMDTGAGVSRTVLDFVLCSDTMVLITTPEPTAFTDAYAMVKLASAERADLDIKIVLNLVHNKHEAMEVFDKLSAVINHFLKTEVHFLGFMPRDPAVEKAVHLQQPFTEAFPKAPSSIQLKFITRKLLQIHDIKNDGGGIFTSLFRRIKKQSLR